MDLLHNFQQSLYKGFIDQAQPSGERFKPALIVNKTDENVLNALHEELDHCETFFFSVAFVTESGLAMLKSHLLDLAKKGVKGRMLTSTFLNFNNPKVFRELLKISNLEVRLAEKKGFHSKGYIFDQGTHHSLIVGSSNLTASALKVNYEWNVKLTSMENGEIIHHFHAQFEDVWETAIPLSEPWIQLYEKDYMPVQQARTVSMVADLPGIYDKNAISEALQIIPNKMQEAALKEISLVREAGHEKGLVVSATGTGKTYLSAFDVRKFAPERMLFIVHREQILQKAKADYLQILGGVEEDFGILSGSSKQLDARYVFATIQMISKDGVLKGLDPEAFDYILIDEVHKAGAASYQKVINHFTPQFLMGMTATPERTDDFNIFELFDYNIAYEIRLQEALEEDMLCPFHYFGVTEMEDESGVIDETTSFSKLVTKERIDHILEKVAYYGHSGERVCGLMFCSRKEEAIQLSSLLNERGLRTVALTGDSSQDERLRQVERLENGLLDYILTVDIFNEGIDIPRVNQVVMLRQTQSSIIFIQQLGRGLRKDPTKRFVTIIDFIGNYKNNYLIPVALSGDRTQNKDNIRRHMKDTSYIKGVSTVNFEEVAKNRIFKAINDSKLTDWKKLKEAYTALKQRIGRVPELYDFLLHNSLDPLVIAEKAGTYHAFLVKMKEKVPALALYEEQVLMMLSQEVLNGKRKHELLLLQQLLEHGGKVEQATFVSALEAKGYQYDETTLRSVQRVLDLSFFMQGARKKYGDKPLVISGGGFYLFGTDFQGRLEDNELFRAQVKDLLQTAWALSEQYVDERPLTLYEKYTRKDVCRLLNWESDESSTMYGYKTKHGTCPIFVTFHKNEEIDSSVAYTEDFLNPEVFQWSTRSNRTLASKEVQTIIRAQEKGIELFLFIKKDDDEGKDFYYLGQVVPDQNNIEQSMMKDKNGKEIPVVHMNLQLERSVDSRLYHYIRSENE